MENWNFSHNWTKGQFLTVVSASAAQGEDSLSLYTEHCDRQNLADIKAWAKEAGYYYTEEQSGGDVLVVSKNPIEEAVSEEFVYTGDSAASDGIGKLMRLLELLKKTVPEAEKYWICTPDGNVVCQTDNGYLFPTEEERDGIQAALDNFREVNDGMRKMGADYRMAHGHSPWRDTRDKAYFAFPLWKNAEGFEYVLVCWGDHNEISNVLAAYQLVSNLYMLRQS